MSLLPGECEFIDVYTVVARACSTGDMPGSCPWEKEGLTLAEVQNIHGSGAHLPYYTLERSTEVNCAAPEIPTAPSGGGGGGSTTPAPPTEYNPCSSGPQEVGEINYERGTRLMVAPPTPCDGGGTGGGSQPITPVYNEFSPIYLPDNFDIAYPQEYFDLEDSYDALTLELINEGLQNTDPIPESYYKNGTRIDMLSAPFRNGKTALGIPRNPVYFWQQLIKLRPEMFNESNRNLIISNKSPIINDQWIKYNPTHKAYMGDQLVHHHDGQGRYAYAIPQKVHLKWNRILHSIRIGKFPGLRGTMNSLAGGMQIFSLLTDFNTGNPDAWINWYGPVDEVGKVYKQPLTGDYFVITKQIKYRNNNGEVIRAKVTYDVYADYIWDADEKKYMGVLKLGAFTEDIDMNNRHAIGSVWEPKML
ncbi:hypothetical protein [Pedobacter sandarakinus]|uniref:hypothetical protein n=1 Tax=Pedobacter sandarakinus TaxID=353156 RepID=UPI00224576D5|nr:hypothetical protein [Pedobacter sandarakinus]MCX2573583.1 hypothetical protein [Pedobacter sandarakinus]